MCFCSNLIEMSLCDAFLEKPRMDTTEDVFRCPLLYGTGPWGNPIGVSTAQFGRGSLLRTAGRSTAASTAAVALSRETGISQ